MIRSRKYDLVLTEDLGRIVRRVQAHLVCELCEAFQTRLISMMTDQVDTGQPGGVMSSIFAAVREAKVKAWAPAQRSRLRDDVRADNRATCYQNATPAVPAAPLPGTRLR